MADEAALDAQIGVAGVKVRDLKTGGGDKSAIDAAVKELLALKTKYKEVTGKDHGPPKSSKKSKKGKSAAPAPAPGKATSKPAAPPAAPAGGKSKKDLAKEAAKAKKAAYKANKAAGNAPVPAKGAPTGKGGKTGGPPKVKFGAKYPPATTAIVAALVKSKIEFEGGSPNPLPDMIFPDRNNCVIRGDHAMARYLARSAPESKLYGSDALSTSDVDQWLDFCLMYLHTAAGAQQVEAILEQHLTPRTYFAGYSLTLADIAIYSALVSKKFTAKMPNLQRWMNLCASIPEINSALKTLEAKAGSSGGKSSGDKAKDGAVGCPPLVGAVMGQVVTRFPPEPSGYLHIGHAKAVLMNDYYARHYKGKLIVRMDDTNPSKEKEEFQEAIINDLAALGVFPDIKSHTSDHFALIMKLGDQFVKEGNAYMDNTEHEIMKQERFDGIDSKCRNTTVAENTELWNLFKKGDKDTIAAGYCLRARMEMQSKNKTMRDPVIYRANATPHLMTGTKYKVYPTYDFACPIVDSVEGVTHAMRTTEYNDRDFQYAWIQERLSLRKVTIQSFARMNFIHTCLSKRKLQWFVDNGKVEGWFDPRFPTVQGVLRRGVTVEALKSFIYSQGASRRITDMEWDKFWATNKKAIDPKAGRYFGIQKEGAVPLKITNQPKGLAIKAVDLHPKLPENGSKSLIISQDLLIEGDDASSIENGEEITLMRWGNVIVKKVTKGKDGKVTGIEGEFNPTGDFKKTKKKICWLADTPNLVPVILTEFDHLISKRKLEEGDEFRDHLTPVTKSETAGLTDAALRLEQTGAIVQLERRGFYRIDRCYQGPNKPAILFMVPDGKQGAMSSLSTKLAHK
jgi:glutamyl-tRNA synthetase